MNLKQFLNSRHYLHPKNGLLTQETQEKAKTAELNRRSEFKKERTQLFV